MASLLQQRLHGAPQALLILIQSLLLLHEPLLWLCIAHPQLALPQAAPRVLYHPLHNALQLKCILIQRLQPCSDVCHRKLRRSGRRGCPQICNEICNRRIRLMSDRRDHRRMTGKDRAGNRLLIKCPQILDRTTAAPDNDYINSKCIQGSQSCRHTFGCALPLHLRRVKDDPDTRIPPRRYVDDIADRRSGRSRDDSEPPDKLRNGLLVLRCKHPHLFQLFLQLQKFFIQLSCPVLPDLRRIELIFTVALIDIHRPVHNDLLSVGHSKSQSPSGTGKHDTGNRGRGIL